MEVNPGRFQKVVRWRGDLYLPSVFTISEDHPRLPYTIQITAEARDGEVICSSLTVTRHDDGPPIVARSLRVLSLPYLLEKGAMAVALKGTVTGNSLSLEPALSLGDVFDVQATRGLTATGRPPLDDAFYADVAEAYLEGEGSRSDRLWAMAEDPKRWGRIVPYKTLDRWVRTAKQKGFIVDSEEGK